MQIESRWITMSTLSRIAVCAMMLVSANARAQSMDNALAQFKAGAFAESAYAFYDILQHDADAQKRDQAQAYLAESLAKLELWTPALFYYSDLFRAGKSGRYYLNAADGLLSLQEKLHDPLVVPSLFNENLDPDGIEQLDPKRIAQINFVIGDLSYRQRKFDDARAFLEYVPKGSAYESKAQYLLALVDMQGKRVDAANVRLLQLLDSLEKSKATQGQSQVANDARELRDLTNIALGRIAYGRSMTVLQQASMNF
jgi:hypothetical protein